MGYMDFETTIFELFNSTRQPYFSTYIYFTILDKIFFFFDHNLFTWQYIYYVNSAKNLIFNFSFVQARTILTY